MKRTPQAQVQQSDLERYPGIISTDVSQPLHMSMDKAQTTKHMHTHTNKMFKVSKEIVERPGKTSLYAIPMMSTLFLDD